MRVYSCNSLLLLIFFSTFFNSYVASDIELQDLYEFQETNQQCCHEWNRTNEKLEFLLEESKILKSLKQSLQELRDENKNITEKNEYIQHNCNLKVELEKMQCKVAASEIVDIHHNALNAAEKRARIALNETVWKLTKQIRDLEHHVSELKGENKALHDTLNFTRQMDELRSKVSLSVECHVDGKLDQKTNETSAVCDEQNKIIVLETQELKYKLAKTKEVMCPLVKKQRGIVELDGVFYYFSDNKLNWDSAKNSCRARGMELVTIEDLTEQQRIHSYLVQNNLKSENWYIGASDIEKEGEYIWSSSGLPVQFTFFRYNQPDNKNQNEHCIHIASWGANGEWNDCICSIYQLYICELERC